MQNKLLSPNNIKLAVIAAIPVLAVLVLASICGVSEYPFPDCYHYMQISGDLNGDYAAMQAGIITPGVRTPGFPVLIAVFRWLGNASYLVPNILALWGTIIFACLIAKHYNVRYYKWIPLLFLLSPGIISVASVPLSETIFAFFLTAAVWAVIKDRFIFSGFCLSLATLCRPIGLFLFILFAAYMLWKRKKIWLVVAFVICANVFQGIWITRNYVKYGHCFYTTIGNYSLLFYKAGSYLSWKNNVPFDEMRRQLTGKLPETIDPFEKAKAANRLGRKILLDNFLGFCLWTPRNLIYFFMPDINPLLERLKITSGNRGTLDVLRRQGPWAAFKHYFADNYTAMVITLVYMGFFALLWLAIAVGGIRLVVEKHYEIFICTALLCGYFMVLPVGNLDWRFRIPVMPILFIMAVYGIRGVWLFFKHKKSTVKNMSHGAESA